MAHAPWGHNTLMRLAVQGVCQGQSIVAVHHFEAPGAVDSTLVTDALARSWAASVATDWHSNCKSAWLAPHTADYTLLNVQSQVLQRPGQRDHVLSPTDLTPTVPIVGGIAGTADDLTTAGVIRWRTDIAGKSHRGRTYIGPLGDVQTDVGRIATGSQAAFTAYATVMINRYTGASPIFTGANLTIYSRPYDSGEYRYVKGSGAAMEIVVPPDYDGNSTFVIGGSLDPVARTQRRRQIGVGS